MNLTVSGGDSTFTMPDLSTMSRDDVKNFFESKGVPVTLEDTFSEEVPKDQMVLQSMAAGEDYTIGDASMPAMQDAGLTLEVSVEKDSDYNKVKKGKVCDQSISAGEKVNTIENKGDEVVLYTSIGPKPTPKPTVKPAAAATPRATNGNSKKSSDSRFSSIDGSSRRREMSNDYNISALD